MEQVEKNIEKQLLNQGNLEVLVFTLTTIISILNNDTTIFYILYFFWCSNLSRIIIDHIGGKINNNAQIETSNTGDLINQNSLYLSLFMMWIYWVFIVVIFGFITNWSNQEITFTNMGVLVFQNRFFNLNLLFIIAQRIYMNYQNRKQPIQLSAFTNNMILLHVSIILGAILLFFVVKKFPTLFVPSNTWGSVLIISPFLILKILFDYVSL